MRIAKNRLNSMRTQGIASRKGFVSFIVSPVLLTLAPPLAMWNPVLDFFGSWRSCASSWGKVSVVAFYLVCWLTLLGNVVAIFNPLKLEFYACPLNSLQPNDLITLYIVLILRLWELTIVVLFVLVLWNGWTLHTVGLLATYWILFYALHLPAFAGQNGDSALDCITDVWSPIGYSVAGVLLLTFAFTWMYERIKHRSSPAPGERTPLT
jgi:hypothetical protein